MKKTCTTLFALMAALSLTTYANTSHHHNHHRAVHAVSSTIASVDVNAASASELMQLKGVGPKKAAAIVSYREQNGRFKAVSDLANVKGIGTKMLAKIERDNPGRLKLDS